jgi:hypothetical protein
MSDWIPAVAGLSAAVVILLLAGIAVVIWFEIAMLIHVIKNPAIDDSRRIVWVVAMLFLHPFAAIIYYFTDRQLQV